MESPEKKKARTSEDEEDRISMLPDELIHKILSFVDAKEAVQTSALSKRWKLIWTTLPFLNFGGYNQISPHKIYMFIHHVLYKRNHQSNISALNLCISKKKCFSKKRPDECLLKKFVVYAIEHNVECLNISLEYIHNPYNLPTFSSNLLKKLALRMKLDGFLVESNCWDLPALTSLYLKSPYCLEVFILPDSCLACLPALTTLCLDEWDLSSPSFSFSLPNLRTLRLIGCIVSETMWNFPALLSLDIDGCSLPENISHILSTLSNLQNLTIFLEKVSVHQDILISCPRLLNLNLTTSYHLSPQGNIEVAAPKLRNFCSVGIISITFGDNELENVIIKLRGWFECMSYKHREKYCLRFTNMLLGLGNAKNLSFDLDSIMALSSFSDLLASVPSPFYNLMYVKLPEGCKESSMSSALRRYLLGGSSRATIGRTRPQVFNDKSRHIDAPVEGTRQDRVSSSSGKSDSALWRGHEVNSEFVCLLDRIMHKYPETFEHFTTKSKKLCTMWLNMLCTSLNDFIKLSMYEVDPDIIVEYRDAFAYLQNLGFDVSWAVSRLNYVKHLRFSEPLISELHAIDCRIDDDRSKLQDLQACVDDAKSKLQDLQARVDDVKTKLQDVQALRVEKMTEIQKAFGTLGTNLVVGFIGDDLLSAP